MGLCLSACVRVATQIHDRYIDWKWEEQDFYTRDSITSTTGGLSCSSVRNKSFSIHAAVIDRNIVEIERLIKNDRTCLQEVFSEETALHMACKLGYINVISTLLNAGCIPNTVTELGTPIHSLLRGIKSGYVKQSEAIQWTDVLLRKGCPIDGIDRNNKTAVMCAVENGDLLHTNFLIISGADINIQDSNHFSPLYMAVTRGDAAIVGILLDLKQTVDINSRDRAGRTPLMVALITIMNFIRYKEFPRNASSSDMITKDNMISIVELLIWKGADVYTKDHINRTPLMLTFAILEMDISMKVITSQTNKCDRINMKNSSYLALLSLVWQDDISDLVEEWTRHEKKDTDWLQDLFDLGKTKALVRAHWKEPRSLMEIARHNIRKELASLAILESIDRLPIPKCLKDFLEFKTY